MRMKDQFRLGKASSLLKSFIPKITHPVEGLIFTPIQSPYGLGGFEEKHPVFKYVPSSSDMPSLDGTVSEASLLTHIENVK